MAGHRFVSWNTFVCWLVAIAQQLHSLLTSQHINNRSENHPKNSKTVNPTNQLAGISPVICKIQRLLRLLFNFICAVLDSSESDQLK